MAGSPAGGSNPLHPPTGARRLFVALDVPHDVREELFDDLGTLRSELQDGRWAPAANWHVTVKFLGAVDAARVPWVEERVSFVAERTTPFDARILGMGTFPEGRRRARVLWAGLEAPEGRFAQLTTDLDETMAPEFGAERRPSTPHLTVARFDPPTEMPATLPLVTSRTFPARELVLYRSHLRRPAPVYEPVARFFLRGPDEQPGHPPSSR